MNKQVFIFIISLILVSNISCLTKQQWECLDMVKSDECDFYLKCLEPAFKCGNNGYPVAYGYKYCDRFKQKIQTFTSKAQKWVNGTLVCLKTELLTPLKQKWNGESITCEQLNDLAYVSHVPCYKNNGFCDLVTNVFEPVVYARFIQSLFGVFEVKDFMSSAAVTQVATIMKQCTVGR